MKIKVEQEVESYNFQFKFKDSPVIYTAVVLSDYENDDEVLVYWNNDVYGGLKNTYYTKESVDRNIKSGLFVDIKALDLK